VVLVVVEIFHDESRGNGQGGKKCLVKETNEKEMRRGKRGPESSSRGAF